MTTASGHGKLIGLLEMVLRGDTPQEREAFRAAAVRYLDTHNVSLASTMGSPYDPNSTFGEWVATAGKLESEVAKRDRQIERQKLRIRELALMAGTAEIEDWLDGTGIENLPETLNGFYPFAVLEAICTRRLGVGRGWQAALGNAMAAAHTKFRHGAIEDWRRNRNGVPKKVIEFALNTEHLAVLPAHEWTTHQKEWVEQRIVAGDRDLDIAKNLAVEFAVMVSSESVRAIRKARERRIKLAEKGAKRRPSAVQETRLAA